ncbi:sulfite exporter TauE/SafE family protein [Paenibacillus sp. LHD-117]|uniref:sulfite exporter TauE/SafE family protein n=1 Tax=Paenibacillus sp. LHD-117 TaxID=3071412 RepID=UPI0027DF2B4A|nr:sulfite exporter TauE/SafE family protein [Paenibacillus sp. LHD-117]MDQ6421594.1 sulfite exporter TauE/SafE family protein [Paenibacillus sp. LHD-117]
MTLTWNAIGLILLTGLFSAPHCIGMCGGIVSTVSLQAGMPASRSMLLYNGGRIVSYTAMGAMMGAVGSFVDVAGRLAGVRGLASIIGGIFVLLWLWRRFQLPFMGRLSGMLHRNLVDGTGKVPSDKRAALHVLATGLAFGFLPCGLTYAMGMNAASTGSALEGAATMALFGLATFPALAAAASIAAFANRRWRRFMRKAGVVTAMAVGILSILRGLAVNGLIPSVSPWLW